ncbi:hypothetical protein NE865_06519 [Phthorimaea operculella]|nr:hypothetical protein NE865_06519 [Phthorimaea operculella]
MVLATIMMLTDLTGMEAYVSIIVDMYKEARSFIRTTAGVPKSILVTEGVHQGSVLSPYLFSLVLDTLTEAAQKTELWTFIYADDVSICTSNRQDLVKALAAWKQQLEAGGLVLSVAKTQYMECNVSTPSSQPIVVDGQAVQQCDEYNYSRSQKNIPRSASNGSKYLRNYITFVNYFFCCPCS